MGPLGFVFELVVLTCIAIGIAANAAVVGSCNLLSLGRNGGSLGPWRYDAGDGAGCVSWDKDTTDQDDWILNMARACSMMALVCGCILACFAFFNQCLCPLPCTQHIMDITGAGVQIGLALTWPMIRSEVCDANGGCYWNDGSWALLITQLAYFCASIFSRCMREPRYKRRQERQSDNRRNSPEDIETSNSLGKEGKDDTEAVHSVDHKAEAKKG